MNMQTFRNENIGKTLKHYRKQNGYSVREVSALLLSKYHIKAAEKTVYGWESNQAHPTINTFFALCELYKISNVQEAFSLHQTPPAFRITPFEKELIQACRMHSDLQKVISLILKMIHQG